MGLLARKQPVADRSKSYLRGWEHRREREESVERDLAPEDVALWRKHRSRFRGTPQQRLDAFQKWMHDHPSEVRAWRARSGEETGARLVRQYEAKPFVAVPCKEPWRFRTKAACDPNVKKKPKWSRSSLLKSGRSTEVPCGAPDRYRVKELCLPRKRTERPVEYYQEPEEHAFAGLLG